MNSSTSPSVPDFPTSTPSLTVLGAYWSVLALGFIIFLVSVNSLIYRIFCISSLRAHKLLWCKFSKQCSFFWIFYILAMFGIVRDIIVCFYGIGYINWGGTDDDLFENITTGMSNSCFVCFFYVITNGIKSASEGGGSPASVSCFSVVIAVALILSGVFAGLVTVLNKDLNLTNREVNIALGSYYAFGSLLLLLGIVYITYYICFISRSLAPKTLAARNPSFARVMLQLQVVIYSLTLSLSATIVLQVFRAHLHLSTTDDRLARDPLIDCFTLFPRVLFNAVTVWYCRSLTPHAKFSNRAKDNQPDSSATTTNPSWLDLLEIDHAFHEPFLLIRKRSESRMHNSVVSNFKESCSELSDLGASKIMDLSGYCTNSAASSNISNSTSMRSIMASTKESRDSSLSSKNQSQNRSVLAYELPMDEEDR
jgi:hypothetical protein